MSCYLRIGRLWEFDGKTTIAPIVFNGTVSVVDVWYDYVITGQFHCGVSPLRTIRQFGTECGLVSTVSPLPGKFARLSRASPPVLG
jgi:hypothetical protein